MDQASSVNHSPSWVRFFIVFLVVAATWFVFRPFLTAFCWAGVILTATWPLYSRLNHRFIHARWCPWIFTFALTLFVLVPLSMMLVVLIKQIVGFISALMALNHTGEPVPSWLSSVPLVGQKLTTLWAKHLSHAHGIQEIVQTYSLPYGKFTSMIKQVSFKALHACIVFIFTILFLFFFYRDGDLIFSKINVVGHYFLPKRWLHYRDHTTMAVRSAVNGVVLSSLGMGIVMGVLYAVLGLPMSALLGLLTSLLMLIPFGAVLLMLILTGILYAQAHVASALVLLIVGLVLLNIVDHLIKPLLIGSGMKLPFLVIIISVLGGLDWIGVLGVFVGPVVMVLFFSLWAEMGSASVD